MEKKSKGEGGLFWRQRNEKTGCIINYIDGIRRVLDSGFWGTESM